MLNSLFQEKEDKAADDEEASPNVTPKWNAGQVTAIHLQTEEEERAEEESQGNNSKPDFVINCIVYLANAKQNKS